MSVDILSKDSVVGWTLCILLFIKQSRLLTTLYKKPFENIVGKGENTGNKHFLLFTQCFLPFLKQISVIQSHLFCHLQMLSIWININFCRLVELTLYQMTIFLTRPN